MIRANNLLLIARCSAARMAAFATNSESEAVDFGRGFDPIAFCLRPFIRNNISHLFLLKSMSFLQK
jgi:hypothetical protein